MHRGFFLNCYLGVMEMKPLIIGFAGGSASGKSTICLKLKTLLEPYLSVTLINGDCYYKEKLPNTTAPFTGKLYVEYNHPDVMDFEAMDSAIIEEVKKNPDVILIEQAMLFCCEKIRNRLDGKVYVDCQADERLARRLKRNMDYGQDFEEILSYCLDSVRYRYDEFVAPTRWYADIILNGSSMPQNGTEMIAAWIQRKATEQKREKTSL